MELIPGHGCDRIESPSSCVFDQVDPVDTTENQQIPIAIKSRHCIKTQSIERNGTHVE